jgi:SSS family solute:Na+ symporter
MLAYGVGAVDIVVILAYLLLVIYLGWLGYRRTKTAADYMVAGRKAHPFIMALSYGATFISTSAIVGFGGVAGMFGMSLLWLTFLNIFVGIFIAFVLLGGPTRRMGHHLDAHTYPELLGRRFNSRFIQVFVGLVIFLCMPLYASAVMIGGTEFILEAFNLDYGVALLIFSVVVAGYVIAGGLKAVMYTDALQGVIMFVGMAILLVWAYQKVGGVQQGHEDLAAMGNQAFAGHQAIGHQGWTSMPKFGWGAPEAGKPSPYDLWWIVVTTIVMGVGIGVLAQPQLNVRFMTVKSKRELNRAVVSGGIFILAMTGVAFTVGAITNVYFYKYEKITGKLLATTQEKVIAKKTRTEVKPAPCKLLHLDTDNDGKADTYIVAEGPLLPNKGMVKAEVRDLGDGMVEVMPHASSFIRAVKEMGPGPDGKPVYAFNPDSIIPTFVTRAMPPWFSLVFLLTLLAAAMSTLSSQFHTLGTAFGRDVVGLLTKSEKTVSITRLGIIIGLVVAVIIGFYARGGYIIARATAIFFGLCASTFLPTAVGGLFWKRMTKAGAIASMVVGFVVTAVWVLLIKLPEAEDLGLVEFITGGQEKRSLLASCPNWPVVDSLLIALPLSVVTAIVVSLLTKPPDKEHVDRCFARAGELPQVPKAG